MSTTQDASLGLAVESTYGTSVTPTRWLEYLDESLDYRKNLKQGLGLRVGARVARSARRVPVTADGGGDITVEACSKGMGLLWQACLGTGVSTLVSGTTYQQLFTLADWPASLTIQKGLPQASGAAVDAYTFVGAMVDSWEFDALNADIAKLKVTLDAKDVATATAYAAPSYAVAPSLFHFANGSIFTGALTAPTATTLASAATPLASVRGATIKVDNRPKIDRYNLGNAGRKSKPTEGLRQITGKLDVEYDSTLFRDAVINETPMTLVLTYTGAALSTGVETLQVVVPEIKFTTQLPMTNGTDLILQSMAFDGLDNLTGGQQPVYVVCRTSDAAL